MKVPMWLLATAFTATVWAQGGDEPEDWKEAIELPREAKELRDVGVPPEDVRTALRAARAKGVKGGQARALIREGKASVDENGPVNNFGAFVQARLDEGLRGKELAAAIRAEHQAHGIGKGKRLDGGGRPGDPVRAGDRPGGPPDGADREHPNMDKAKAKAKARAGEGGGH